MEAYKSWVRRNHQWVASIESIANTMTWLLPERFASSELTPEAVSTAVGLVTVMNQYIVETTPKSTPPWIHAAPEDLSASHDKDLPWPVFVSLVKEVEVLVEMAAEYYRGKDGKWTAVAAIETAKALLRLRILHKSGYKMLLDGGETENQEGLSQPSHCDPLARRTSNTDSRQGNRTPNLRRHEWGQNTPDTCLQGRAMEALYRFGDSVAARPSWVQSRKAVEERSSSYGSPCSVARKRDITTIWKQPGPVAKLFVVAELALISRPLLYVLLIRRYGLKSWRPWLASLAIDITGLSLLFLSDSLAKKSPGYSGECQGSPCGRLSSVEKQELNRRKLLWAFYLLRNPFFDRYSRHQLERIEKIVRPLPLFGTLTGKALDLLAGIQSIYSYTSAS